MPGEFFDRRELRFGCVETPDANPLVRAARSDLSGVVEPRQSVDGRIAPGPGEKFAAGHAPDAKCFVGSRRRQPGVVPGKFQGTNRALMAGQIFRELAFGDVPDFDAPVVTAGCQPFPIGTGRDREHFLACDRRELELLRIFRPAPHFDFTISGAIDQSEYVLCNDKHVETRDRTRSSV